MLAVAAKLQRQRDLDATRLDRQRDKDRRRTDKGKSRARDEDDLPLANGHRSDGSSPGSSPGKRKPSPPSSSSSAASAASAADLNPPRAPATGFAALRSHLSSYLVRTTPPASAPPLRSLAASLRHHYATDPVRLLTVVCFVFALSSWVRRSLVARRARGEQGIGVASVAAAMRLAVSRVAETVRMGTRVTSL